VLKTIERLRKDKMTFTRSAGEAVITEAEAQSYLDRYLGIDGVLVEAADVDADRGNGPNRSR